jgi:rhodanese-related sulfurtransferase
MFGLFNKKEEVNYKELLTKGAIIIDVRSKEEFADGHVEGATNLPLNTLPSEIEKIGNKDMLIITCCMSGGRSSMAKTILNQSGYTNVYDGGGWRALQKNLA